MNQPLVVQTEHYSWQTTCPSFGIDPRRHFFRFAAANHIPGRVQGHSSVRRGCIGVGRLVGCAVSPILTLVDKEECLSPSSFTYRATARIVYLAVTMAPKLEGLELELLLSPGRLSASGMQGDGSSRRLRNLLHRSRGSCL